MPLATDISDSPLPGLPARSATCHKGEFGRALLIGGSRNMSGAIVLAGLSTLRSGAGLVTVAVPNVIQLSVAAHEPSIMTFGLSDDAEGRIDGTSARDGLERAINDATVVAIGPGIGQSQALTDFVAWAYTTVACPVVVDADGLNALSRAKEALKNAAGPRILTPHPGEFARLTGRPTPDAGDSKNRAEAASALALVDRGAKTVVVLKGASTVITDGRQFAYNTTGNPGMATGGSGDVLTGIIAGLLCQGLESFEAARLATHVHGRAGDLAAAELGQVSVIASDLINFLPAAFQSAE